LSKNPKYRKTKRYTNQLATKIFTIDDARKIVLKVKKLEGLTKNSLDNYEKLFNDFDRFFGEKTDIASLTKDDVRDFIHWQLNEKIQFQNHKYRKNKKKGVSIGTVNTYLNYAKAAFNVLVNEEIVEENIFDSTKHIKEKQKKIETLSVEEIHKLLRSLDKSWYSEFRAYVLIHVLLDTFGRINEVLSIRKQDIDFEKHAITFQNTKNGKIRIVPITKKTVKILQELIEETEDFNSEYVFLTHHGNPLKPDSARKHFRDLLKRAGIKKRVYFHLFRHTASEMFLRQNGSVRVLQKILGHSELTTTSRYAHVLDSTIKEQHEQFSPLNLIDEKEKRKTRRSKR
jgi:integrase/recombinase XerD